MADAEELTIEQLAARTGLSVRNIRSHVTRGLLPPPRLRGRTGFYGDEHVERLAYITRLQAEGFNLAAISRLVDRLADPTATKDLFGDVMAPWLSEEPVEMKIEELAAMFGEKPDPSRLTQLLAAGVIEVIDDTRVLVVNPALIQAGLRVMELGFSVDALLDVLLVLATQSRIIADSLVDMFLKTHWAAYVDAGRPSDALPELTAVIDSVRPLAADGVIAAFWQAMNEAAAVAFERIAAEEVAAQAAMSTAGH